MAVLVSTLLFGVLVHSLAVQASSSHHTQAGITPDTLLPPMEDGESTSINSAVTYFPARGPALPLAVRSPYTSAWISMADNGFISTDTVKFWDASPVGWEGMIKVDNITYEWLGEGSNDIPQVDSLQIAKPVSAAYDSQYSNFTLAAGPVAIFASFFSTVLPQDLCRTSIPISYLAVSVRSTDSLSHNVSLYTDVNGAWVTQPAQLLTWTITELDLGHTGDENTTLYSWLIKQQNQQTFAESNGRGDQGVFPLWANFTWNSAQGQADRLLYRSGDAHNQRFSFASGNSLDNTVDTNFRAFDVEQPVFAFEHIMKGVSTESKEVVFTIGNVVEPAIRYSSPTGIESLEPWWKRCYGDLSSLIAFHWSDLKESRSLAVASEAKLKNDIQEYYSESGSGGNMIQLSGTSSRKVNEQVSMVDQYATDYTLDIDSSEDRSEPMSQSNSNAAPISDSTEAQDYYSIVALAARQIMGAYVLTVPSSTSPDQTSPYAWQKEISSNGNINTVDVIFPAMPFFLWSNPNILRYALAPLFENQERGLYPNQYSMHDLGSRFPNATGHTEGTDEAMPVEECGNMIILTLAIYRFTGDASYLQAHYPILRQWAQYLIDFSLIPAEQLSTDDFAGTLANQTNLAIKGIVGLAAMSEIAAVLNDTSAAENYHSIAADYYTHWTEYAIDPTRRHALLAYQWRSSWGLLYNAYPAKLLNLTVIPQSLYDMQSDYYPTVAQLWGVPLDNRHYWTKSDWELWTAAYCRPETRALFVHALAYWLNTTSSNIPFSDLYQTIHEGENVPDIVFAARPVQGGLFSLLALLAGGTN